MIEHAPLYAHIKRPEWGYGAVVETADDRTTYGFDDGSSRTISHNHTHMMSMVELGEPEATEVRKRIAKHWAARTRAASVKPKAKSKLALKKGPRSGERSSDSEPPPSPRGAK